MSFLMNISYMDLSYSNDKDHSVLLKVFLILATMKRQGLKSCFPYPGASRPPSNMECPDALPHAIS